MSETLILAAVGLLTAPLLLRRFGGRLRHSERARIMAVSLVAGMAFLEAALLLTATPTVSDSLGLTDLAEACRQLAGSLLGSSPIIGWTALALAMLVPVLAGLAWRRCRQQECLRADPWVGDHQPYGRYEIVVLPSKTLVAASVPGRPGQVILSRGVLDALSRSEVDAVIRHEVAHLEAGHSRYLLLAAIVGGALGWLPMARRSADALRLSLEQWADAAAVRDVGSSRAIVEALRSYVFAAIAPHAAAFSVAETLGERIRVLTQGPPAASRCSRLLTYVLITVPMLIAGASLVTLATRTHHLVALVPYCPI